MTDAAMATPAKPISADVACRGCGYNLRGLDGSRQSAARCPECGRLVAMSLDAWRLSETPRTWRSELRWGAGLVLWGGVAAALALAVAVVMVPFGQSQPVSPAADVLRVLLRSLPALLIAMHAGAWMAASPTPGLGDDHGRRLWRRTARACAVVAALSTASAWALGRAGSARNTDLSGLLIGAAAVATPAAFVALAYHLALFAERFGLQRFSTTAETAAFVSAVSLGAAVLFLSVSLIGALAGGAYRAVSCLVLPTAGLTLVWFVVYAELMVRFRQVLRDADTDAGADINAEERAPAAPPLAPPPDHADTRGEQ